MARTPNIPALRAAIQELAPDLLRGVSKGLGFSEAVYMPGRIKQAFAPIHELNNDKPRDDAMRWLQSIIWEANTLQSIFNLPDFHSRLEILCRSAYNLSQDQSLDSLLVVQQLN